MVTLDTQLSKIQDAIGKKISAKDLEDVLFDIGMELDEVVDDEIKIDITPDRPDMVSVQGVARALRSYMKIRPGLSEYKIIHSNEKIIVDKSTATVRPFTLAAIVKGLVFDEEKIKELIWVQEKLHATFARGRRKAAIGIYPYEQIKPPIRYIAEDPKKIKFMPLDFDKVLSGEDILEKHPTGQQYAHLLREHKKYPIFIDSNNQVLSMPPIINSQKLGKVTESTKEVFIECSGWDVNALRSVLNLIVTILADMGGKVYSVDVDYPDRKITTPNLEPEKRKIAVNYVNRHIGINLDAKGMKECLEMMGYGVVETKKGMLTILVPAYRVDILHDVDVADDVARAYGFENIKLEVPNIATVGDTTEESDLKMTVFEQMVGLGYQEIITHIITSKEEQHIKMNLKERPHINLGDSQEKSFNMLRSWLIPSIMKSLANNKHHEYPQKLFEVDSVLKPDKKLDTGCGQSLNLAAVSAHTNSDYTEIKGVVERLLENIVGIDIVFKEHEDPSFISGRCSKIVLGEIEIGVIGEMHPQVLNNWGIDVPVCGAEISLSEIMDFMSRQR
ncbi:MAG: phenylalanine--tRNA ligase subunit beta [archaeon]|nr:phenylalanine--tRNA ligase subunit beta [archaeon]